MTIKRFPRLFYDDHCDRFEYRCEPVNESTRYVWLNTKDSLYDGLISDALYYSDTYGPDGAPHIVKAAKRFLAAHAR